MPLTRAVLLIAHGTVDSLDELPEFLANIRRGHAAPPELLAELRRRYEAIGGKSPLNEINRRLAAKLEAKLGLPVRMSNRLARPYAKDVIAELAREGVTQIAVVPLAQYSAHIYEASAKDAAAEVAPEIAVACAPSWGSDAGLVEAFASRIRSKLVEPSTVILSAHSLPVAVVRGGDPYERDFRASAAAIAARLGDVKTAIAFQSQGMSTGPGGRPVEWLGPTLRETMEKLAREGERRVLVAPIGFLADHVEVLYDIDIEARALAAELGLRFERTESLDDADDFVEVLAGLARPLLAAS